MLITYRNYTFAVGAQGYTHRKQAVRNDADVRTSSVEQVTIRGTLHVPNTTSDADAPAAMIALVAEFERAFSVDGGDFTVAFPDGPTALSLRSADMIGGLRVTNGPNYDTPNGVEWVRKRDFEVTLEGELFIDAGGGGSGADVEFSESVTFEGTGGPRIVILETMEGPPVEMIVNERTKCRAIQEGRATRRRGYAVVPPALFAGEREEFRRITRTTPQIRAGQEANYEISWYRIYESIGPFTGFPTRR